MKSGSRLWIISDEISINMLTKPSTQTPVGIFACWLISFTPEEGGGSKSILPRQPDKVDTPADKTKLPAARRSQGSILYLIALYQWGAIKDKSCLRCINVSLAQGSTV